MGTAFIKFTPLQFISFFFGKAPTSRAFLKVCSTVLDIAEFLKTFQQQDVKYEGQDFL